MQTETPFTTGVTWRVKMDCFPAAVYLCSVRYLSYSDSIYQYVIAQSSDVLTDVPILIRRYKYGRRKCCQQYITTSHQIPHSYTSKRCVLLLYPLLFLCRQQYPAGFVAQMVERSLCMREVVGSMPTGSMFCYAKQRHRCTQSDKSCYVRLLRQVSIVGLLRDVVCRPSKWTA